MPLRFIAVLLIALGATSAIAAEPKDAKAKPAAEKQADTKAKSTAQIDINRARAEELMTLDGIGEARAKAIIKGRPYRAKDELVDKKILPESVYEKIKDRIIAHQVAKKK